MYCLRGDVPTPRFPQSDRVSFWEYLQVVSAVGLGVLLGTTPLLFIVDALRNEIAALVDDMRRRENV